MIARLGTWLFYAVVFFLLGVWTGPHMPSLRQSLDVAAEAAAGDLRQAWNWSLREINRASATARPETAPVDPLNPARAAFARGDNTRAIALYQSALATDPGNADAEGELGNVYFNSGQLDEAANAYHAAALRLLQTGDADRARELVIAIRRGNPALADDLAARLNQPSSAPGHS